ncbi:PRC-barrel domain-containing protein [uncultured Roseibium sp.]|uniref:PRC-barrel domain-containing protein n=1 Tax=uncultured Roseibium sp. TaxID=1936171 RepID=UPI002634EDE5|nr:PRC-barrel domain-containing protein [uncultured Roseibium sp.]
MDQKLTSSSVVNSKDVNGTAVYGIDGEKVGEIDHLIIEKNSGTVTFAVMTFGGFLGLGQDEYPIPWKKLSYDVSKDAFVTDISEEQLKGAPEAHPEWHSDREWEKRSFDYFSVPYYWM